MDHTVLHTRIRDINGEARDMKLKGRRTHGHSFGFGEWILNRHIIQIEHSMERVDEYLYLNSHNVREDTSAVLIEDFYKNESCCNNA